MYPLRIRLVASWLLVPLLLLVSSVAGAAVELGAEPHSMVMVPKISSNNTYTFPVTPVGQTSTVCSSFCFYTTTPCDGAGGTAYLVKNVTAPFRSYNYRLIPNGAPCSTTGTPIVSFPVNVPLDQIVAYDFDFSPVETGAFTSAWEIGPAADPAILTLNGSTPAAGANCTPSASDLCIDQNPGDRRFQITSHYHTTQSGGATGSGTAISLTSLGVTQGGLFWFFSASNPEMLFKIIDGCSLTGNFWVFFASTTNVGYTVTVTDTKNGNQAVYHNADLTTAQSVQDTAALPCQ
jgi:hypothetical protein